MRVIILTAAFTLSTFLCVSAAAQSSEESTARSTDSSSFKTFSDQEERPCEQPIKERIAKFELANDYTCSIFEQLSSHIINTNIHSPSDSVENISEKLMDGMKVSVHMFYATPRTLPLAFPMYDLCFSYSNSYHSEEEVIRHFDESSEHLILIVDNEPIYLDGIDLGASERRPGKITIDEKKVFYLTMAQLEKLAVANKVDIKLGNSTGTLSKQTLQAIGDMSSLSDLSAK